MKIALVILHADPARGGAERYTFDLAEALAARGESVSLVASTFGPRPAGVRCVELGERGVTRLARYRRFLDDLDRHLDSEAYEVVHAMLPVRRCDVYHPHAGVAAEAVVSGHLKHAGAVKRALAGVANRVNVKRRAFAAVERELLAGAKPPVVLCLSEYVKGMVRTHYPLADDRLATLFNAVDLAKFDPAARPGARDEVRTRLSVGERVVGLMVAQDFERKGLGEAIRAVVRLTERPVLVVVGKEDPEPYRRMARELGIEGDVVFAGATTDVYTFYAAADFFVLPTRHDPCSLVVLESLAMGVPVISTRQNGACEIMTSGVHGVVLESADDGEGLVGAVRTMMGDGARARMREACLDLRAELAYERHLGKLIGIYKSVIHARPLPRRDV